MFTYLNILWRWDIWQMLAGLASAASKIQMLISFHNLAYAAQLYPKKILFWITIIFDINTKHTHSCPELLFPPSVGFSSQTEDITLLYVCISQVFRSIQGSECIVYDGVDVLIACALHSSFKLDNFSKVRPDLKSFSMRIIMTLAGAFSEWIGLAFQRSWIFQWI